MKAKKLLMLSLLFVMCTVFFVACGSQNNNDSDKDSDKLPNIDPASYREIIDNQVIIILTEKASRAYIFHDYTPEDFSEIGVIDVDELDGSTGASTGLTYRIRQCLLDDPSGNTIPDYLKHNKRFFCITLDKHDEDNVWNAVSVLEQRSDIYLAEPNWVEYPCDD